MPPRPCRHVLVLAIATLVIGCAGPEPGADTAQASDPSLASRGMDAEAIGSLRNAQVAIPRVAADPPVTYFTPTMDSAQQAELARTAPGVRIVSGLSRAEALARAEEADGADASYASPEFLEAATNLKWVQARSAGVDHVLSVPGLGGRDDLIVTNFRAVHGPAIADHVFAMLLALTRDLPHRLADQAEGRWNRSGPSVLPPVALEGRTLLVVGLGGIGTEIARRGHGFGMRVLGIRRSDDPGPDFVERVGKAADLPAFLAESDVVALAVPLTAETEGMIDSTALATMRPGGYLLNIARGQVVDQDALLAALRSGRLAGAGLDVTDPEPLPADHPLWRQPNVVITPHVASRAELTTERGEALLAENLRRFGAGEPLLNVVDKRAGY
ncbi:MAG: D-2-hydroxyacid dehydrogenase [Gemmatimonadales bacterium]